LCWRACRPGADDDRAAVCNVMIAKLPTTKHKTARLWLIRQLGHVGRGESVEALAGLLDDKDSQVSESARRALQNNPSPEAARKLMGGLESAQTSERRVAFLNALAYRAEEAGVSALARHAESDDDQVRAAAVLALAETGDASVARAIIAATAKGSKQARGFAADAALTLADRLLDKNDKPGARRVYEKLLDTSGHLKCAAVIGLGRLGTAEELPAILKALDDRDAKVRGAAMAALEALPAGTLDRALRRIDTASPEFKAGLLRVLAERGDKSKRGVFVRAASDANEVVRAAALSGLGTLGEAADVPLIARAAATGAHKVRTAARDALGHLPGDEVTAAVVSHMKGAEAAVRAELIAALPIRQAKDAVPAILDAAADTDERVRIAALTALGELAGRDALPKLVELLVTAPSARERREAEKALVASCKRDSDIEARARPVVDALAGAEKTAKLSLLRVLGRIGGTGALAAVRAASKDTDVLVNDAAVRALTEWPDPVAIPDLLATAKSSPRMTHRVLAIRGSVRLLALAGNRPAEERLAMFKDAMAAAPRVEEKKLVLSGLAGVGHGGAFEMARSYLDDAELGEEAAAAVAKIARGLGFTYADKTMPVLKKIIATTRSESLRTLATEALDAVEKFKGWITTWEIAGPYSGGDIFGTAYPPEKPDSPEAKDIKWRTWTGKGSSPWLVNFMGLRGISGGNRAAYLRTKVPSSRERKATLEIGSDDGVKVWLNGKLVHAKNASRGLREGEDRAKVTLKQGSNTLLLKITQGGGDWAACLKISK
ncbi:MAG: HEAT repeat domain-containing protein, partial [Planctomycetota bacterium]